MDGMTLLRALAARTLLSALMATTMILVLRSTTPDPIVTVVPNMYRCSQLTGQCAQTNPPHAPTAINRCVWTAKVAGAVQAAATTCETHTPH